MNDKIITKTFGIQTESIDDFDISYSQFGVKLRKQVKKILLKKGGPWAAMAFTFQDSNGTDFGPEELMLAAFKNKDGIYKRYSYFIVRDKEMATKIINLLKGCFDV